MHDPTAASDIPSVVEIPTPILLDEAPRPKGRPVLAWLAIGLLVGVNAFLATRRPASAAAKDPETQDRVTLLPMELQARNILGLANLLGQKESSLYPQVKMLDAGPVPQRLRFVVLAGELQGPEEARRLLQNLDELLARTDTEPSPTDTAVKQTLAELYRDYQQNDLAARSVNEAERQLLRRDLGWFGELALAPEGGPNPKERAAVFAEARRTTLAFFGVVGGAGVVGLLGFLGLVVLLVGLLYGWAQSRLAWPSGHGAIYAETFALYMALFFLFSFLFSFVADLEVLQGSRLLLSGAAALLSLLALAWPVVRGVPWRQVRQDVGLTLGRRPALEPLLGVSTYAMAIPLVFLAGVVVVVLVGLLRALHGGHPADSLAPEGPTLHPVVQFLLGSNWWLRLQVVVLAGVVAPLVEETMFRGVLYRHLRDATGRALGFAASVFVSATVVSFVFAIIHPYGWIGVPTLMALAFAFTLAREWRGTLVPCMVAHGIQNTLVTLLFIFALGA
jgi:membrane protease YdiL (CAAX protease family)